MVDNSKQQFKAVIKFLILEENSQQHAYDRMRNVYGNNAPTYSTIKRCAAEYKRRIYSIGADLIPGRTV